VLACLEFARSLQPFVSASDGSLSHCKDRVKLDSVEHGADDGHDPVDIRLGAPSEPEQTDRDEEAADAGGRETRFGADVAALVEARLDVFVHPPVVRRDHKEGADEDAQEG
jgi:hypothetical protein